MDAVQDGASGVVVPLSRPLGDVQKGYTPFADGDILWAKITPCMQNGKSCIVRGLENGVGFGSTEFHVFRPRVADVSTEFVWDFLNQETLRRVATYAFTGSAGHQRVPDSFLAELPFPRLSAEEQARIVDHMTEARALRRAKLAEAEALLTGLDGFLLDTLGLTPPPKNDRKIFAVYKTEVLKQGRINSDYFHPERILALRAMDAAADHLDCRRLEEVVDFIRDQINTPGPNYLSLAHVQSHTGELVDANEESSGTCSEFKCGDVLFARLRPYLNKVYRAEMDGCCSPEFHVLRSRDTKTLRADYLAAILRSSLILDQTRHMMTGNTHPRLTNEDVVNLVIPIPENEVQETIVAEVRCRRNEARRLRAEAEDSWKAAKRWFEEQLLGGDQP